MKRVKGLGTALAVVAVVAAASVGAAEAACKKVKGHIVSEVVPVFSNGEPCTSPAGICTEGRFTGRLKGRFTFVAQTLTPFNELDMTAPPDVAATTGVVELDTRFCRGTLVLSDTSAFSIGPDGLFGGLETVDGAASSGGCLGASGRIRVSGVFMGGCVDCEYEGEVCKVGSGDDDDGDDDDDDDDG